MLCYNMRMFMLTYGCCSCECAWTPFCVCLKISFWNGKKKATSCLWILVCGVLAAVFHLFSFAIHMRYIGKG
jgi:hypothetical protein